ncbi:hypothetical protein [Mucilaginibacter dorajii]|nr:hypothetical protein [Mucilaginibacter dorajii]MCS3732503.1 hypothetical protein [Mucilaginibacter dorajii]
MKKHLIIIILFCCAIKSMAQTGTFNYEFSPLNGGPSVKKSIAVPLVKYKNYNTYWFVNPNTGARHLMVNGSSDIGIIILDDRADTNVVYQDKYQGDQFNILGKTKTEFYIHPDNDHRPMRVHYNIFNAGEIYLTFAGNAVYDQPGASPGTIDHVHGFISGTLQLFREPKYEQTDKMPGCNCDPTVYAKFYDEEIGRTPSACENALLWRVFNGIQKAFNNLVPAISFREDAGGKRAPGDLIYRETGATIDVTGPLSTVDPCNPNNERRAVVSVNAATRPFTQDTYGLSFFKLPDFNNGPLNVQSYSKKIGALSDSTSRLLKANKITALQQQKIMLEGMQKLSTSMPDTKQMEMEGSVKLKVIINSLYADEAARGVTGERYRPVVRHTIPGSAFDIYVPAHRDEDGSWTPNKVYIYYGKFNVVNSGAAGGNSIKSITPVYAPTVNKITVFNLKVMVEGGNDLIAKVLANIDLKNIQQLIDNPKTK